MGLLGPPFLAPGQEFLIELPSNSHRDALRVDDRLEELNEGPCDGALRLPARDGGMLLSGREERGNVFDALNGIAHAREWSTKRTRRVSDVSRTAVGRFWRPKED